MEELNNLKYVDAVMSDDNIQYLVGSKKIEKITLKPYCDIICLFLSEFSKKLNSSSEVKNYPDLKALSFGVERIIYLNSERIFNLQISLTE